MDVHQISFAKITVLRNDLAEIVVDNGVDINVKMVDEIHHCFLSIFSHTFSLLINKTNSYSTQLDALMQFGTLASINKIAIFAPNKMARMSADFSATIPSSKSLNIEVFIDRNDAILWLH